MTAQPGDPAPPLTLRDRDRQTVTLETYPDKHLVLAFYVLAFSGG